MRLISKVLSRALMTAAMAAAAIAPAMAGSYPERPVEFVVPWPPGDLEDILTRIIANDFQKTYGSPAAVVNKPGGGGGPFPGAVFVAKAPADGYEIGSFVISVPVIGPTLGIPELSPNPFEPLGIFLTYPFVIATSKDAPYKSMKELAAYAQHHQVALGDFGASLPPTRVTLALAKKMGFKWGSQSAFDALDCNTLASGDVDVMNTTIQQILPCLDKVRILASITEKRISKAPDAPTVAEIAPGLKLSLWNGLFVRKGTPEDARQKIIAIAKKAMLGPKAQKVAEDTGAQVYWKDASAAKAQIESDRQQMKLISGLLDKK